MDRKRLWEELGIDPDRLSREDFDVLLNQYDSAKAEQNSTEAAAFEAIMDGDYTEARMIIRGMAAKDRAVLAFWADELNGVILAVQTGEERY